MQNECSGCSARSAPRGREGIAGNRCAPKSPDPFCKSIGAQSKHLPSKPFYHLIPASFFLSPQTSREGAERSFSWRMIECRGWLEAQLPRPPQADFTGNSPNICTAEPSDRPREISVPSNPTSENPTRIARCCSPSSPHQLKQGARKSVFSISAPWPFFKKQLRNSKDFKGPAFQIWIIHFPSKRVKVQETLCHCRSIVIWQIPVKPLKRKVSGKLPDTYPSLHATEKTDQDRNPIPRSPGKSAPPSAARGVHPWAALPRPGGSALFGA